MSLVVIIMGVVLVAGAATTWAAVPVLARRELTVWRRPDRFALAWRRAAIVVAIGGAALVVIGQFSKAMWPLPPFLFGATIVAGWAVVALSRRVDRVEQGETDEHLSRFIAAQCELGGGFEVREIQLRAAYSGWCTDQEEVEIDYIEFLAGLRARGLEPVTDDDDFWTSTSKGGPVWHGVRLRARGA